MRRFIAELFEVPAERSILSRYTSWNGVFYALLGVFLYGSPGVILTAITGQTALGSLRLSGMSMAIIGWFYWIGGRTGVSSFGLATIVDRALVPVLLGGLVLTGSVQLQEVIVIAILDPVLALGALLIWRSERRPVE